MADVDTSFSPGAALVGKRVAVTGGQGFLGGAIVRVLRTRGVEAVAVRHREYDLVARDAADAMMRDLSPDVVVHAAAAVGGIGANVANPGRFLYENAVMGLNVLDAARLADVSRFVLISTACAYPQSAPLPLREEDLWEGRPAPATGPYGLAKRLLHEACATYNEQYGTPCSVVIPANLYGPGDNYEVQTSHVIPAMIRRFVEARQADASEVVNWGSGRPTREFLFVDDAAEGIVRAAERDIPPIPINLGTGVETSIADLSRLIATAAGYTGSVTWDASKPDGQPGRYMDVSRARELLEFTPRTSLAAGLDISVRWYIEHVAQKR